MENEQDYHKTDELECPIETPVVSSQEGWISRHSKEINAWIAIGSFVTTAVLAIFAYLSWTEVQMQRDLAFKQFIVANAPSVRTYVAKGFQFDDNIAWMVWNVSNMGGPVNDIVYKSVLMCCGSIEIQNPNTTNLIIRTALKDKLSKNENAEIKILVNDSDTIRWLKSFVEEKNACDFNTSKYK